MKNQRNDASISDTAKRIQENVSNLPVTSIALAGLLGAGAMALFKAFKFHHQH